MPYNPNPPANPNFEYVAANVDDWRVADKGKWFIGVIDTHRNRIYVVPVNVFEGRGALDQETVLNKSQRAMNRYASGVPADKKDKDKFAPHFADPEGFWTFGGRNWLEGRPVGQTHHTAVATHYGSTEADCLGFTLIKVTPGGDFAQLKASSTSLNKLKPGVRAHLASEKDPIHGYSFSRKTTMQNMGSKPNEELTGAAQMPTVWRDAIVQYFRRDPFNIKHMAVSND